MISNVNSEDLMLGMINLYKEILTGDKQDVFISAMDKKLTKLAKKDHENFNKIDEINQFNLRSVRKYGNVMSEKLDKITK